MLSSATGGEPAVDTPEPPYYGYELASKLAVKGAKVGTLAVATPNIYGYYSDLPGGSYAVMLVNADPSNGYSVAASSLGLSSSAETEYSYSAASPSVTQSSFSGSSVPVPAESVVVLTNGSGAAPTPTPTPTATSASPTSSPTASPTSASPSPSPSPTATATAAPGSCQATWSVVNSWSGGFQLGFTVTNPGSAATSGWNVSFSWPGTQAITQIWSATATQSGAAVSVTNASYDGSLAAGGSTTFGLLGSGTAPAALGSVQCTAH